MEFDDFVKMVFASMIAGVAFALKLIFSKLDEGNRRMSKIETELTRQKQETNDLHDWMKRVDGKLETLIESLVKK